MAPSLPEMYLSRYSFGRGVRMAGGMMGAAQRFLGRRDRAVIVMAAVMSGALACGPALGAEDCGSALWPLAAERSRLAEPGLPTLESGARLALGGGDGVAARLVLRQGAELPHPPGRKPAEGTASGFLLLDVPAPVRMWQVTLDAAGWVDAIAEGRTVDPAAFTGLHACPGVRKSVRFVLPPGPAVLQVSGVEGARLGLAVAPAR